MGSQNVGHNWATEQQQCVCVCVYSYIYESLCCTPETNISIKNKLQGYMVQHGQYSQYFIISINEV